MQAQSTYSDATRADPQDFSLSEITVLLIENTVEFIAWLCLNQLFCCSYDPAARSHVACMCGWAHRAQLPPKHPEGNSICPSRWKLVSYAQVPFGMEISIQCPSSVLHFCLWMKNQKRDKRYKTLETVSGLMTVHLYVTAAGSRTHPQWPLTSKYN